jgi:hypothetical protein
MAQRAKKHKKNSKRSNPKKNPLYKLIGLAKDEVVPVDAAKDHDFYIYDLEYERIQRGMTSKEFFASPIYKKLIRDRARSKNR